MRCRYLVKIPAEIPEGSGTGEVPEGSGEDTW